MNVLLRADASTTQGTGHVMRCLTLAEELVERGHSVTLWAHLEGVSWLSERIASSGITHENHPAHTLDISRIRASSFDWVVVDSYEIPAEQISEVNAVRPVLAIVDSDSRKITATLYLDQNLGTEITFPAVTGADQLLLGSDFALVRKDFLQHRTVAPVSTITGRAHAVVFFGGTDPNGTVVLATRSIVDANPELRLTVVCAERWMPDVYDACGTTDVSVLALTPDLPYILSTADIVVSAAGTSAWDVCTLGRPAIFVAVVDNQQPALLHIELQGVALTLDATAERVNELRNIGALVSRLADNDAERSALLERCATLFDGKGTARVVDRMEGVLSA
jgi:spore coat polysaccharide biosynthesis predicted glycosyltransferase SpsG